MTQTDIDLMTQTDIDLINQAQSLNYTQWYEVEQLIKQATSQEAKQKLHNIRTHLYHLEEYHADLL